MAATATGLSNTTATTGAEVTATTPPVIDPALERRGYALVAALRQGGYNLYLRHGSATDGEDKPMLADLPQWWEQCALQRRLDDVGREQARRVSAALSDAGVPVSSVKSSQFCRTRETATLLAQERGLAVTAIPALNHAVGQPAGFDTRRRFEVIAEPPPAGTNALLVSHTHGSAKAHERVLSQLAEGEIAVYRPDGKGDAVPIARITVADWEALRSLAATRPRSK
jgi:phosphohistidine phosphatase SixA